MTILLLACFGGPDEPEEICADGWPAPEGGCPEQELTGDSDPPSDSGPGPCDVAIDELDPGEGELHGPNDPIRVTFSGAPRSAELKVSEGSGTARIEGDVLIWTPDEPLPGDTRVEAVVAFCDTEVGWQFVTDDVGAPIAADLTGTTWLIDPASLRVVHPEGVGSVLESYLEAGILVQVLEHDDELDLLVAFEEGGDQAACRTTERVTVSLEDDPFLSYGPETSTLWDIEIKDLGLGGAVASDGSGLSGLRAEGVVDTRPLVPLVDEGGEDDAMCELMAGFGVECVPCEDGSELCIDAVIEEGVAQAVAVSLVETPECDDTCEECDGCGCASGPPSPGFLVALLGLVALRRR